MYEKLELKEDLEEPDEEIIVVEDPQNNDLINGISVDSIVGDKVSVELGLRGLWSWCLYPTKTGKK